MSALTSHKNYHECYNVYRKKSQNLLRNNELLSQRLPQVIQDILKRKPDKDKFNILSVGSCTGQSDFQILKIVQEELKSKEDYQQVKIFNRAVEPNGSSLSIYKAEFEKISTLSKDQISLDLCEKTFEEYTDELDKEDNIKFDIVHFIHSLYFVDLEKTLTCCMENQLVENGRIVCILADKRHHKPEVIRETESFGNSFSLVKKILEIADKKNWKYEKCSQDISIEITDIFEEESREGNFLLDFLTQKINFRSTASEEEAKETLEAFQKCSVEGDGKRFVKTVDNMLIIRHTQY